jgi:hypothetical protein
LFFFTAERRVEHVEMDAMSAKGIFSESIFKSCFFLCDLSVLCGLFFLPLRTLRAQREYLVNPFLNHAFFFATSAFFAV